MPASSQGFPTSGIRARFSVALGAANFDQIYPRPVRRVTIKLLPSTDSATSEPSRPPMTSKAPQVSHIQMGKASPQ